MVFTKFFTFWVVLWFVEVLTSDPQPLKQKIPTLSRFILFFYRMSTRGPKTKLTQSDQNNQITLPPIEKKHFPVFFWQTSLS